jgi:hypothetical protein
MNNQALDNRNRAMIILIRSNPERALQYTAKLFEMNRGCLKRFCKRFGTDWTLGQAFIHLHDVVHLYDLKNRMSVIGYWIQRLQWKLPEDHNDEHAIFKPNKKLGGQARKDEREELRNLQIERPDHFETQWDAVIDSDNLPAQADHSIRITGYGDPLSPENRLRLVMHFLTKYGDSVDS